MRSLLGSVLHGNSRRLKIKAIPHACCSTWWLRAIDVRGRKTAFFPITVEKRLYTGQSLVDGWREATEGCILFSFETVFTGRVKAGPQIETWQRRSVAGLHASRDSFYRTARDARQGHLPFGTASAAMPPLRLRYHRRPWPAAQAGTRPASRLDLGTTRNLSSVQQDLHDLAPLVGTIGTFQPTMPTAGL
jgi:hypothetical protein